MIAGVRADRLCSVNTRMGKGGRDPGRRPACLCGGPGLNRPHGDAGRVRPA